jgi:phosphocarrier protein
VSGPEVLEATVRVRNVKGLHARASAKFVRLAETFDADVTVTREDQSVGGTSIMGLLMLAAGPGSDLKLSVKGPDAKAALDALVALVADGFGEECVDRA